MPPPDSPAEEPNAAVAQPAVDIGSQRPEDAVVDARDFAVGTVDTPAPQRTSEGCSASGVLEISPCPLPAPCLGVPYAVALSASGGVGPYRFQASGAPDDLQVSSDGRLTGVARTAAELTLLVTDRAGSTGQVRSVFVPRESCWFAHVAPGPPARLELFDRLLSDGGSGAIRLPGSEIGGESVVGFEFSPNGRSLAVLLDAAIPANRLRLFAAPEWRELPFELPEAGSISSFSWSPDSLSLAVALLNERGTFLGGVRLETTTMASGGVQGAVALPFEQTPVNSPLHWFAERRVVFLGLGPEANPENQLLHHAELQSNGFGPVTSYDFTGYTSRLRFVPGPDGFFAIIQFMNFTPGVAFYSPSADGLRETFHRGDVVPSPTARHAAVVFGTDELRVYRGGEQQLGTDDPSAPLPLVAQGGCQKLLAWSPRGDRVACATDGRDDSVRLFQFAETDVQLTSRRVEGSYVYPLSAAALRRRAFSPQGRWFVFTTSDELYLAEVTSERATVSRPAIPLLYLDNPSAAFAFSPDETLLLHHQGSNLWLRQLQPRDAGDISLATALPPSSDCSEVGSAPGPTWCGSPGDATSSLAWSPDSRAVAYRVSSGPPLTITSVESHGVRAMASGPGGGDFAFQP